VNDSNPQTDIRQLFASFGPPKRETCYGWVTDEEYERRAVVDRAKAQARRDCTLCDDDGYRNMYLCHHGAPAPKHSREAQKKRLRVIDGDA
jgi:transposase